MIKDLYKKYLKAILLTLLFISGANAFSQNETTTKEFKELNKIAKKMFVDVNNKDFDAIVDMTYPKVFDIASKDQMKALVKDMFEGNQEFTIEIPKIIPKYKLSKIYKKTKDSLEYAFVSYDMKMKMTFHKQEFDDQAKKMMIPYMETKGMFVKFTANNSMDVLMKDRITILIKDSTTKDKWTMVNYDPDSPMFYQMVPASLLESAKLYKQDLMLESKKESEKLKQTEKN